MRPPGNLMDSLLGWKDFGEALFAQSRAVDDVKQYPAYSIAMQAKLANVQEAVTTLKTQAATAGIVVEPPAGVALTANYYGVLNAGQLPLPLTFNIKLLGTSVLADARLEVVYELDGVVGSQTALGTFTVTAVTKPTATVTLRVTFAGVLQGRWVVTLLTTKAAAPVPDPPNGDLPPTPPIPTTTTPSQLVALSSPQSTSGFTLVGSGAVTGPASYRFSVAAELLPGLVNRGVYNLEAYVAYQQVGTITWTQVGATVTGQPAVVSQSYDDFYGERQYNLETQPGYFAISRDIVLPLGSFNIGLFARLLYTNPVNFGDGAFLEAL